MRARCVQFVWLRIIMDVNFYFCANSFGLFAFATTALLHGGAEAEEVVYCFERKRKSLVSFVGVDSEDFDWLAWLYSFPYTATHRFFKVFMDEIMFGAPVDLSFKSLSKLTDAWSETPCSGLRPLKKNSEGKYLSCSLRLSNNSIGDLYDLHQTVSHFLAEPSHLAWLDLSFNKLSHMEKVLCELHGLRVLYLHGNNIYTLSEVDRLGVLPHLHTVTLHGNPIETNKAYRNRIISALPLLKMMDFSAVTQQERVLAKLWHQSNTRCRNRRKRLL